MSPEKRLRHFRDGLAHTPSRRRTLAVEYGSSDFGIEVNDLPSDQELLDDEEDEEKEKDKPKGKRPPPAQFGGKRKEAGDGKTEDASEAEEGDDPKAKTGNRKIKAPDEEDPGADEETKEDESGAAEDPQDDSEEYADEEEQEADNSPAGDEGEEGTETDNSEVGQTSKDQPAKSGAKSKGLKITASIGDVIHAPLVTKPSGRKRLNALANRLELSVGLNALMVSNKESRRFANAGAVDVEFMVEAMPDTALELSGAQPDFPRRDAVNLLLTLDQYPLTAQIIARRFSRALMFGPSDQPATKILHTAQQRLNTHLLENVVAGGYGIMHNRLAVLPGLFAKLAPDADKGYSSFYAELLAQYLLTGDLRLNPPPLTVQAAGQSGRIPQSDQEHHHNIIAGELAALCDLFDQALSAAQGRIYVL